MGGENPRAPGWYPDPWGGEGERYFDGTSWSRDQVDALPVARPKGPRTRLAWVIGAVVALGVIAAIAAVVLGSGSAASHTTLDPAVGSSLAASTTTTTRPTLVLSAYDKGDCATWNQDRDHAPAHVVDCAQPHLIELVAPRHVPASFDHYPTEPEWDLIDATVCAPVVEDYLQTKLDPQGQYQASSIRPTEDGWRQGDRDLACGIIERGEIASDRLLPFSGQVDPAAQYQVLAPGTCMPAGTADSLGAPVPCTQPHLLEVSGAVDLTGRIDHAPTDDDLRRLIDGDCERIATTYLGHAPNGDLTSGWLDLEPGSWDAGHRITECTIERDDGNNAPVVLTAPLRAG